MMDILEHPIGAVAFRLYSLPDASASAGAAGAWTCLAAVLAAAAAAAGLWRLRNSAPAAAGTVELKPSELEPSRAKVVSPVTAISSTASSRDSAASTSKERYTAYYRDCVRVGCCGVDDDDEGDNEEEEEAEEQDGDGGGAYRTLEAATAADPFGWEVVRSLSLGPTVTGRYRSPAPALSDSVVRLWDYAFDAGATAASPRRRGRVMGTVAAF